MSNENIPKDYDFKKEKDLGAKKWEDEELYKFSVMELNLDI